MTPPLGTAPSPVDALLERSLNDIGIPPRPVILDRIAIEMQKEDPDFKRLAQIIGADVGLGASLIKTANSPFFGFRNRVRSVSEALMLLGLDVASRAVAGIVLRKAFPVSPHLERFWDGSGRIARISGWLAQHLGHKRFRADDAYTYGLFRDCGIPVLFKRFPQYEHTLREANAATESSFTAIEEQVVPSNHAIVGSLLAQSWWLPEEICLAIRHHHDLTTLQSADVPPPGTTRDLIAAAQLAEHLVQHHTRQSLTHEWEKLGPACLAVLELGEDDLAPLYAEAEAVVAAED